MLDVRNESVDVDDPLIRMIYSTAWYKDLIWGLCENSAVFMLTILLPSILAVKHRSKYGVQMIGTILGVSISLTYMLALMIASLINPLMKPISFEEPYI